MEIDFKTAIVTLFLIPCFILIFTLMYQLVKEVWFKKSKSEKLPESKKEQINLSRFEAVKEVTFVIKTLDNKKHTVKHYFHPELTPVNPSEIDKIISYFKRDIYYLRDKFIMSEDNVSINLKAVASIKLKGLTSTTIVRVNSNKLYDLDKIEKVELV